MISQHWQGRYKIKQYFPIFSQDLFPPALSNSYVIPVTVQTVPNWIYWFNISTACPNLTRRQMKHVLLRSDFMLQHAENSMQIRGQNNKKYELVQHQLLDRPPSRANDCNTNPRRPFVCSSSEMSYGWQDIVSLQQYYYSLWRNLSNCLNT